MAKKGAKQEKFVLKQGCVCRGQVRGKVSGKMVKAAAGEPVEDDNV
jgi:hypothetical protein